MAVRKRAGAGPIRPGETDAQFRRRVADAARQRRRDTKIEVINSDPTLGQIMPA